MCFAGGEVEEGPHRSALEPKVLPLLSYARAWLCSRDAKGRFQTPTRSAARSCSCCPARSHCTAIESLVDSAGIQIDVILSSESTREFIEKTEPVLLHSSLLGNSMVDAPFVFRSNCNAAEVVLRCKPPVCAPELL